MQGQSDLLDKSNDDHISILNQQIVSFLDKVKLEFAQLPQVPTFIAYVPDPNTDASSELKSAEILGHFLGLAGVPVSFLPLTDLSSFQAHLSSHIDPNLIIVGSSSFAQAVTQTPGMREVIDAFGRKRPDGLHTLLFEGGFGDTALKIVDGHYLIRFCHKLMSIDRLEKCDAVIDVLLHPSGTNGLGLLPDLLNLEQDTRAKERSFYMLHFASLQHSQQDLTVAYHLRQGLLTAINEDPLFHDFDMSTAEAAHGEIQRAAQFVMTQPKVKIGLFLNKTSADTCSANFVLKRWLLEQGVKTISIACVDFPGPPFKSAHQSVEYTLLNKLKLRRSDIDLLRQSHDQVVILFESYEYTNNYDNLYVKNQLRSWKNLKVIFTCTADYFSHRSFENCFLPDPTNPNSEHLSRHVLGSLASQKARDFVSSPAWQTFLDSKKSEQSATDQELNHSIISAKLRVQHTEFDAFLMERRRVLLDAGHLKETMSENPSVFISYAWAEAGLPRTRQQGLLRRIVYDLNTLGLSAWLDIERMTGDIDSQMLRNIKESKFVLILDTALYRERMMLPTNVKKEYDSICSQRALDSHFNAFALQYEEKLRGLQALPFETFDFVGVDNGEEYIKQLNYVITKLLGLQDNQLANYIEATKVFDKQLLLVPGKHLLVDHGQDLSQALDIDQRLMGYLTPSVLFRQGDPVSTRFDLEGDFKKFLDQDVSKTFILLGSSGSGKSLFTLSTFKRWLQEWHKWRADQQGTRPQYLPIYIPLRNYANERAESCIALALTQYGLTSSDIDSLRQGLGWSQQLLFILDGYDELGEAQPNYTAILADWDTAKILISCRPEGVEDKLQQLFGTQQSSFISRFLSPFSPEEIVQYIRHFDEKNAEENHQILQGLPGMMPLLDNPFLLNLTLQALPRLVASRRDTQQSVNRSHVYQAFIDTTFNKESFKRQDSSFSQADYHTFAQNLAFALFIARETRASPEGQGDVWKQFFESPAQLALREACPLKRSASEYSFIHKSVYEYFVACHLWSILGEEKEVCAGAWGIRSLLEDKAIVTFLAELFQNQRPFGYISGGLESEMKDCDRLLPFQQLIYASRDNPAGAVAAASAITVLNEAQVPFIGWDLHNTHLSGADLSYSVLAHANLSGANLRSATLIHAFLYDANFQNADLRDVDFGQFPIYQLANERRFSTLPHSREPMSVFAIHPLLPYMAMVQLKQPQQNQAEMSHIVLVDYETFQHVGHPLEIVGDVTHLDFSPDGKMLASASNELTGPNLNADFRPSLLLWDTQTWKVIGQPLVGHKQPIFWLQFSFDSTLLVSVSDSLEKPVRLWDCQTQTEQASFKSSRPAVFVLEDSRLKLMTASLRVHGLGQFRCFDVASGTETQLGQDENLQLGAFCFAVSPDGQTVIAANIRLDFWDVNSKKLVGFYEHSKQKQASQFVRKYATARFSRDGTLVVAGLGNLVHLIDSKTLCQVGNQMTIKGQIVRVGFSADGRRIIALDSESNVHQWSLKSQLSVRKLKVSNPNTRSTRIHINAQGTTLLSYNQSHMYFWDMQTQKVVSHCELKLQAERDEEDEDEGEDDCETKDMHVMEVLFNPNGNELVLVTNMWLHFFDAATHAEISKPVKAWAAEGADGHRPWYARIRCLTFSPDGKFLLSAQNNGVKVWDMKTHRQSGLKLTHPAEVNTVAFSPDGKRFVSASSDDTLRLWEFETRTQIGNDMKPKKCRSTDEVSFTLDGTKIIVAKHFMSEEEMVVFDAATGNMEAHTWESILSISKPMDLHVVEGSDRDIYVYQTKPDGTGERALAFQWPSSAQVEQHGNDFVVCDANGCLSFWRIEEGKYRLLSIPSHSDIPVFPTGTQFAQCKMGSEAKRIVEQLGGDILEVNLY